MKSFRDKEGGASRFFRRPVRDGGDALMSRSVRVFGGRGGVPRSSGAAHDSWREEIVHEDNPMTSRELPVEKDLGCTDTTCCPPQKPVVRDAPKVGRNDPCPCGSGRKHKKCCA